MVAKRAPGRIGKPADLGCGVLLALSGLGKGRPPARSVPLALGERSARRAHFDTGLGPCIEVTRPFSPLPRFGESITVEEPEDAAYEPP